MDFVWHSGKKETGESLLENRIFGCRLISPLHFYTSLQVLGSSDARGKAPSSSPLASPLEQLTHHGSLPATPLVFPPGYPVPSSGSFYAIPAVPGIACSIRFSPSQPENISHGGGEHHCPSRARPRAAPQGPTVSSHMRAVVVARKRDPDRPSRTGDKSLAIVIRRRRVRPRIELSRQQDSPARSRR